MSNLVYPAPPAGANSSITKPSAKFRLAVTKVSILIVLFIALYVVMLMAGIGLALALCYLGLLMIIKVHNLGALLIGAGVIGIGLMVCFFLLKFLFAKKEDDVSDKYEATEEEYPELFEFIRKLSAEVQTSFPAHIYITSDVNASVSYESSLRSLFLPAKKNLTIGLGLVNMLNVGEFKALLAHEFGHFSQESMRAGSYVYQVNRVIYNLLFDNRSYDNILAQWASIHNIFAVCANVTVKIIQGIQWVLQTVYKLINKSYMGLSREMEFHADAVAARAAGSNNNISALRKAEFADAAYQYTIEKYNEQLKSGYKATNLFSQQRISAGFIAQMNKLPVVNGLPHLDDLDKVAISYRRINIADQWASHPTRAQREVALTRLNVAGEVFDESPWLLFGHKAAALQDRFTGELYATVKFPDGIVPLDDKKFTSIAGDEVNKFNYPEYYNGYFDRRIISLENITDRKTIAITDLPVFLRENANLYRRIEALQEDMQVLEAVAASGSGIRYFDLDGQKMDRKEALVVKAILAKELGEMEADLQLKDASVFAHFSSLASRSEQQAEHKRMGEEFVSLSHVIDAYLEASRQALEKMSVAYNETLSVESARSLADEITVAVNEVRAKLETVLPAIAACSLFETETPGEIAALQGIEGEFFLEDGYNNEMLEKSWQSIQVVGSWCNGLKFEAQKGLVSAQLQYLPELELA